MKLLSITLLFCLCLLCVNAQAQQPETKPHIYSLRLVTISDTRPIQILWTVDGNPDIAYKSLDAPSLLQWVSELPKGTEIDYQSRWAGLPLIGNLFKVNNPAPDEGMGKKLNAFGAFCHSKGIFFCDRFPVI